MSWSVQIVIKNVTKYMNVIMKVAMNNIVNFAPILAYMVRENVHLAPLSKSAFDMFENQKISQRGQALHFTLDGKR